MDIMDMHNHSIWSDGSDTIEDLIKNAIENNIKILGISDHFHIINDLNLYCKEIEELKNKYTNINLKIGTEINIFPYPKTLQELNYNQFNNFDYILLENLDNINGNILLEDLDQYIQKFNCKIGLAHTNLFKLAETYKKNGGLDYVLEFIRRNNIFWEINANWQYEYLDDIIYYENNNPAIKEFIQQIINKNIKTLTGSDNHSIMGFDIDRLIEANKLVNFINN